jgi:signal peptidase II
MRRELRIRTLLFLLVAALVLLDLWSKSAVFGWWPHAEGLTICPHGYARYQLLGNWLALTTVRNPAAALGLFGDWPHLLVIGRGVAVLLLGWLLVVTQLRHRLVLAAMVLVLSGAVGNLCDNLWLGETEPGHPYGMVRDFIDVYFGIWEWHFPTFNVADSCITVGAVLWVASGLFHKSEKKGQEAEAGAARS